jgi:hypothetical protein
MTLSKLQDPSHWYIRTAKTITYTGVFPEDVTVTGVMFTAPSTFLVSTWTSAYPNPYGVPAWTGLLFRSTDYGKTWDGATPQVLAIMQFGGLQRLADNSICLGTGPTFWVSSTEGLAWNTRTAPGRGIIQTLSGALLCYLSVYLPSPNCYVIWVYRSTNYGVDWTHTGTLGDTHNTPYYTGTCIRESGRIVVLVDAWSPAVSYYSDDDGVTWSTQARPVRHISTFISTPGYIVVMANWTYDTNTYVSDDDGASYYVTDAGVTHVTSGLINADDTIYWFVAGVTDILKTDDQCDNWVDSTFDLSATYGVVMINARYGDILALCDNSDWDAVIYQTIPV